MFITAHTIVITRNAGHLLLHAVRLSRASFVAAFLKADNKSSSLYLRFSPQQHTQTHCTLTAKKGPLSFQSSSELKRKVEITHGDSEAHSLTCKSRQCRTGNAWGYLLKTDKTTQLHFIEELPGKTPEHGGQHAAGRRARATMGGALSDH